MKRPPLFLLLGAGALVGTIAAFVMGSNENLPLPARIQDAFGYGGSHADIPDHGRSLFHSGVDIGGVKEGMTYAQFNSRRVANAVDVFAGFGCLKSCSGHEAGFEWAARYRISKPSDCLARSWSQLEGCVAFVMLKNDTG